jgi:hypothetical protein
MILINGSINVIYISGSVHCSDDDDSPTGATVDKDLGSSREGSRTGELLYMISITGTPWLD